MDLMIENYFKMHFINNRPNEKEQNHGNNTKPPILRLLCEKTIIGFSEAPR
jgi:hypothetical protein